jgi:hypothetical protein
VRSTSEYLKLFHDFIIFYSLDAKHMPSSSEKNRRKALRHAAEQNARAAEAARIPISREDLTQLFGHLDTSLAKGCDHSLRFTRAFLHEKQLSEASIVPWLGEYGGYCDCEVLANVAERWSNS